MFSESALKNVTISETALFSACYLWDFNPGFNESFLLSETTTTVMVHDDDEDVIECYNEEIPVLECAIELVSWPLKFLDGHMDAESQGVKCWIDDKMTSVEFGSQSIHVTVAAELPPESSAEQQKLDSVKHDS